MFTVLRAFFTGLFGSLMERLFPVKTAADEKASELQAECDSLKAEAKAAANTPTKMAQLIEEQRKGKI